MPKSTKIKVGNKQKGRQSAKHKASGIYARQRVKTETNRKRKRTKHVKRHPNDLQTARLL